jgi:hypothetical protein
MPVELDRLLSLDRALDDVRFADRTLIDREVFASWRGPARDAFVEAFDALPPLLRSAAAALERERRAAALVLLDGPDRTEP